MSIDPVNIGATGNDPAADTLRSAFDKVNSNEAYLDAKGLADLADVEPGTPDDGDMLVFNGSVSPGVWEHLPPADVKDTLAIEMADIVDVDVVSSPAPQDGDVLTYDGASSPPVWRPAAPTGGGASSITVKEEGSNLTTALDSLNFVGGGATAAAVGDDVTVTVRDYATVRLFIAPTIGSDASHGVTTTYTTPNGNANFQWDFDTFYPTHFRIVLSNGGASSGTLTLQLTQSASPTTPLHTGGDDLAFSGSGALRDSGWRTFDNVSLSGLLALSVACKSSAGTPNLTYRSLEVHFKR